MAENPKICSICDQRHISKASTVWCSECKQAFCAECLEYHSLANASRSHVTTSVKDHSSLVPYESNISCFCEDHDDKYQMFCPSHDSLLCLHCLDEHSECKNIVRLGKIVHNIKESEMFRQTEQKIADVQKNMKTINDTLQQNSTSIQNQKEEMLAQIAQTRIKINDHLDNLEQMLKDEICQVESCTKKVLSTLLDNLQEKQSFTKGLEQQMTDMKMYGTELEAFLSLRHVSSEVILMADFLETLVKNKDLDQTKLYLDLNKTTNILSDLQTFGTVSTSKTHHQITLLHSENKQAQIFAELQMKSINNIILKSVRSISTYGVNIRGCEIMPDGKMVFSDYGGRKRIIITDAEGKYLSAVWFVDNHVYDIVKINSKCVAVSSGAKSRYCISLVDIKTKKITRVINVADQCFGITYNGGFIFCCAIGKGIQNINLNNGQVTTIIKRNFIAPEYIAVFDEKVIFTDQSIVACSDMNGNMKWIYSDQSILQHPYGLSVNNVGNVFVVSKKLNSVVVLSPDGQLGRQILSEKDGLKDLYSLHYDRLRDRLLVSNRKQKSYLFEVSL